MTTSAKDPAVDAVLELLKDSLMEGLSSDGAVTVSLRDDGEPPADESLKWVSLTLEEPAPLQLCLGLSESTRTALGPFLSAEDEAPEDAWPAVRNAVGAAFERFTRSAGELTGRAATGAGPADESPGPDLDYRADFQLTAGGKPAGELWLAASREALERFGAHLSNRRARQPAQESNRGLDALMHVELPVTLTLGAVEVPFGEVMSYSTGSVVKLGCAPDAPVDVVVNGRPIARGTVVSVDGKYAVRISEVLLERRSAA